MARWGAMTKLALHGGTGEIPRTRTLAGCGTMTGEDRARFLEQGYVVVRSVLEAGRLAQLSEVVAALIARALDGKFKLRFSDRARGLPSGKLEQVLGLSPHRAMLEEWLASDVAPRVEGLLNQTARCTGLGLLFAGAGRSVKLGWHRDGGGADTRPDEQAALDADRFRSCSFQAPLKSGDRFHELVPGTHLRRLSREESAARIHPGSQMPGAVTIHLEPGDMLFRHAKVLHRGNNIEGAERWTFVGDYWCERTRG